MEISNKELKLTPKRIEALHQLGIYDVDALLSYYPFRYEIIKQSAFSTWKEKDKVHFEGEIVSPIRSWRFGRKKTGTKFDVMVDDQILHITIFNRPWAKQLKEGQIITISGIYQGKNAVTAINYQAKPIAEIPTITPVYASKAGIQQRTIRDSIAKVFAHEKGHLLDFVPTSLQEKYQLLKKEEAIAKIHFPSYEEFLKFFLAIEMMKQQQQTEVLKVPKSFDQTKIDALIKKQPYALTKDQMITIQEVLKDLKSTSLMYRLVQGDVGCGKTVVAAIALYACVLSGMQGALLAPTEILARQHEISLKEIYKDLPLRIETLYSQETTQKKKEIYERLEKGENDILIGTHALLQDRVHFKQLGLVIVDEQQRFGVAQRRTLKEKGEKVDFLLMSATPIPRTLASSLYGDMEVSTIETMPEGRKPVITKLIKENSFRSVLDEINQILDDGHQLYVICAAIDKNEDYDARNVMDTTKSLEKLFLNRAKVGTLHGKMSSQEKQEVMQAFYNNEIQVLVSTTVVEVGMNVVNATGMIIYDSDRFGMSQIHQLRGRIQRGSEQGRCYLLTDASDSHTLERLEVLEKTSNGFEISYEDLRLRGPGDILGTRQSGVPDFVLGNIIEDTKMIEVARSDAKEIYTRLDNPMYQNLKGYLLRQNEKNLSFVD